MRSLEGDEDGAVVLHIRRDVVQDFLRQPKLPAVLHDHLAVVLLVRAVIDFRRPLRAIGDKHLVENHVIVKLDGKHILVPIDVEGQAHAARVRSAPGVEGKPLSAKLRLAVIRRMRHKMDEILNSLGDVALARVVVTIEEGRTQKSRAVLHLHYILFFFVVFLGSGVVKHRLLFADGQEVSDC